MLVLRANVCPTESTAPRLTRELALGGTTVDPCQWALNPQVLGSSPRGGTGRKPWSEHTSGRGFLASGLACPAAVLRGCHRGASTVLDVPGHKRWREDRQAWELIAPRTNDPLTGARRTASRLFRGKEREADRELARFVVEIMDERVTSDAPMSRVFTEWLGHIEGDLSPTTLRMYRQNLRLHILPALGHIPIANLTVEALDTFYRAKIDGGLSPTTVRRLHSTIRSALGQAAKWGWAETNVAALATVRGKFGKPRSALPSPVEIAALLVAAAERDPSFGLVCWLAVATGMRRGEIVGLQWRALDLDNRSILVDTAVIEVGGKLEAREPKWHSNRVLAIDPGTALLLGWHRSHMERQAAVASVALRPDGYVWSLDLDGARPIRPESVTVRWRNLCRSKGIKCRFHDLRHYSATQLIAAGVDVRTVAGRLGHANASTTLNIYSHAIAARDQAAATVLGDLLAG